MTIHTAKPQPLLILPADAVSLPGLGTIATPQVELFSASILTVQGQSGIGKSKILAKWAHHSAKILGVTRCFLLDQMYEHLLLMYKPIWWNITIPKIIRNGLGEDEARNMARGLLEMFKLIVDVNRRPLDLSGGEKHIILLLQMYLTDHVLFFIDEPTSGLDRQRVHYCANHLRHCVASRNSAMVLVTHDDDLIQELGIPIWSSTFPAFHESSVQITRLQVETLR